LHTLLRSCCQLTRPPPCSTLFPYTTLFRSFLEALSSDPNPGVRLVAVDALAAGAKEVPDAKTIESLREKAFDPTENGYVRAKAADRKSTRLNSSHDQISYAVFCLKKKKKTK